MRRFIRDFATSSIFDNFLMLCVFLNTLVLAADGLVDSEGEAFLNKVNLWFTVIFTIDMVLKQVGMGLSEYFSDIMNSFDCAIVILSLVEIVMFGPDGGSAVSAFKSVRVFRTFRVLRVTRLIRSL